MDTPTSQQTTIAQFNDAFRTTFVGGMVCITPGIENLEPDVKAELLKAVREFNTFDKGNDPNGEHDFGSVAASTHTAFWKIDAYDKAHQYASPDATNPNVTSRVLTIMLAEEY